MDEYSPKRHDIAQLKFLCQHLYDESLTSLGDSHHGWVNDPTSALNIQLNELVEHIAAFMMNYKIKHQEDSDFSARVDQYLDDTFMLFSNYGINAKELQTWQSSASSLFNIFDEECRQWTAHASHTYQ
ncbi:Hha toxicity attenuator [Erwinia sp. OLTSP20]|uniref:Hha toxicity modulator TomB n=1 Tax=unclassified Erwinia TaxID=2622719 RepID=UPI000C1A7876|nr:MULTISPECIES: Hha toxicity modulator TomB [unclassified Erwinia]PIJ52209.1 Hha toxicity attenuator [Erwinia sp. OAMSP11]PIJ75749.1 Hha toxicity attenuator [Erwinia sp. OLSSP12]PIJ81156.1 Hha toxicity attenuator [Erwinia sp. OLMTSP26]PIJ84216.1 Hha toxicity attenuator [Erwinia sp. OLCASP19]PIJ88680.1 Hha toxicity attenuator [Erwinia sp. OLMDSP33]